MTRATGKGSDELERCALLPPPRRILVVSTGLGSTFGLSLRDLPPPGA